MHRLKSFLTFYIKVKKGLLLGRMVEIEVSIQLPIFSNTIMLASSKLKLVYFSENYNQPTKVYDSKNNLLNWSVEFSVILKKTIKIKHEFFINGRNKGVSNYQLY